MKAIPVLIIALIKFSVPLYANGECDELVAHNEFGATSYEELLALAAGGQSRAQLANRAFACVETQMPTKDGSYYKEQQAVLASGLAHLDERYIDAWTYIKATDNAKEKIDEIYKTSAKYNIPTPVLFGAMVQESSLQEMGLTRDFTNWACGIAQLNMNDWCEWAEKANPEIQAEIEWPKDYVDYYKTKKLHTDLCSTFFVVPEYVRPIYDVAMKRMQAEQGPDTPEYMLEERHVTTPYTPSTDEEKVFLSKLTKRYFPKNEPELNFEAQAIRFQMARSFARHCSEYNFGIDAGAFTFKAAFDALPDEIKNAQRYKPGEKRPSTNCKKENQSDYFPLAVGWLLADAIYNAGPEILPGVMAYQKRSKIPWDNFSPENLVDAIEYSLTLKDNGLSDIGRKEAHGHVHGVLNAISSVGQ